MKVDEYRQILRNLELHYQDFLRDTKNSQLFSPDERMQTEKDFKASTKHYEELLQTMEKGEPAPNACSRGNLFYERAPVAKTVNGSEGDISLHFVVTVKFTLQDGLSEQRVSCIQINRRMLL